MASLWGALLFAKLLFQQNKNDIIIWLVSYCQEVICYGTLKLEKCFTTNQNMTVFLYNIYLTPPPRDIKWLMPYGGHCGSIKSNLFSPCSMYQPKPYRNLYIIPITHKLNKLISPRHITDTEA